MSDFHMAAFVSSLSGMELMLVPVSHAAETSGGRGSS
jgi:hypothetical protein